MSDRSLRRRRHNPYTSTASNALYVGYVEDEESIGAIMKKFEELERIQEEIAASKLTESLPELNSSGQQNKENEGLTQEQLEEVFRRTSSFTVKSATFAPNLDEVDDLDYWLIEMEDGNTAEYEEEDDYMTVDNDFWDEEFGERKRRKVEKSGTERRRNIDRESLLQRYKVMQVRLQDRNGNFFTVKKKVSNTDPSLPTYIRIPPLPMPRSWAHTILSSPIETSTTIRGSRYFEKDILSMDLTKLGTNFQAVYIDPPLLLPKETPSPGKITLQQFGALNVSSVVPKGFLFIWVEKEFLPDIVQIAEKWNFRYVENFCWIKKNINNQISRESYRYFNKSKLSLLIFRKDGDIELRHQRNPDCVFDFIKPRSKDMLTEAKPRIIYEIIETLLPQATFSEQNNKGDRLLELWAKKEVRRQGWTTVVQSV
ncbi:15733_t:CDS:2 [Acaulospora morrowiae]|uniref:15733_t:CDS:1 n=1 Tax=Acaulospora morrowiae TaxID=94023 RepID=A0A9N8VN13_9GLOM|nr:15733_t:CDS:2 [Acaulospora morrowiae]